MEFIELSFIPLEIIEQILESEELSFTDVCHFGSTCLRFSHLVSKSNQIWKAKFKQMWPQLLAHECYKDHAVSDWRDEFRQRLLIGRQTMELVGTMSSLHIKHEELSISDFSKFEELSISSDHKLALNFMIDELMSYIHHKDRNSKLTNKYYGEKTLRYLRQVYLTKKWEEFKNAPAEEQILERGAVIIAQWSQPTEEISDEAISSQLNKIAEEVLAAIQLEYGDKHAALSVPSELRMRWRSRNISDNYYSPYISQQVIQAVSKVLFKDMGFYGNSELYYSHENSYINKVLELRRGIPITLSILFESITRRLGVKCEAVSFPGHFLLRWRDTYKENVPTQYFYIDVFNGGVFLGKDSCPQFATAPGRCPMSDIFRFGPATPIQVVERMASNLEVAGRQRTVINGRSARLRSALELLHVVNPANLHCMLQLARFYMQYNMDVSVLRHSIQRVTHFDVRDMGQASYILRTLRDYDDNFCQHLRDSTEEVEVKKRDGVAVEFAVGMVMHHKRYNYTCVIIGWDPQCVASEEWMIQMNVKSLTRQHRQPFYHVLVNDGTGRYAAEENLDIERNPNCWVTHCDVGRYFDTFCGTHYQLNPEMIRAYPDDPIYASRMINFH